MIRPQKTVRPKKEPLFLPTNSYIDDEAIESDDEGSDESMNDEDRAFIDDSDPAPKKRKNRHQKVNVKKAKREENSPLPNILDAFRSTPVTSRQQTGRSKVPVVEIDSSSDSMDGIESVKDEDLVSVRPGPTRTRTKIEHRSTENPVRRRGVGDVSIAAAPGIQSALSYGGSNDVTSGNDQKPIPTRRRQSLAQTNNEIDITNERSTRRRGGPVEAVKETRPMTAPSPDDLDDTSEEDVDSVSAQLYEQAPKPFQESKRVAGQPHPSRTRSNGEVPPPDTNAQEDGSSDVDLYENVYMAPDLRHDQVSTSNVAHQAAGQHNGTHPISQYVNMSGSDQEDGSEDTDDDDFGLGQYIRQPAPEMDAPPRSRLSGAHPVQQAPMENSVVIESSHGSPHEFEDEDRYYDEEDCEWTCGSRKLIARPYGP